MRCRPHEYPVRNRRSASPKKQRPGSGSRNLAVVRNLLEDPRHHHVAGPSTASAFGSEYPETIWPLLPEQRSVRRQHNWSVEWRNVRCDDDTTPRYTTLPVPSIRHRRAMSLAVPGPLLSVFYKSRAPFRDAYWRAVVVGFDPLQTVSPRPSPPRCRCPSTVIAQTGGKCPPSPGPPGAVSRAGGSSPQHT